MDAIARERSQLCSLARRSIRRLFQAFLDSIERFGKSYLHFAVSTPLLRRGYIAGFQKVTINPPPTMRLPPTNIGRFGNVRKKAKLMICQTTKRVAMYKPTTCRNSTGARLRKNPYPNSKAAPPSIRERRVMPRWLNIANRTVASPLTSKLVAINRKTIADRVCEVFISATNYQPFGNAPNKT